MYTGTKPKGQHLVQHETVCHAKVNNAGQVFADLVLNG
jgi:hypothetical protein